MRKLAITLLAAIFPVVALNLRAADAKPIKSDIVVKQDDKMARAKIGDVVEIKLDTSPAGSANAITDLKVSIEKNKVLMDKHDDRDTMGATANGGGFKSIYVYPTTEGKATVTVECKKGGKAQKHEYVIEVKGKK